MTATFPNPITDFGELDLREPRLDAASAKRLEEARKQLESERRGGRPAGRFRTI